MKRSARYAKRWLKPRKGSDPPYLAWCRKQGCAVCGARLSEAHHHSMKSRGVGQKAADEFAFPLCWLHHHELHSLSGFFKGWEKEQLRTWQDEQVALHRERYEKDGDDLSF